MRVLVVTVDATATAGPGSAIDALDSLGCPLSVVGIDLENLEERTAKAPPALVVVDLPGRIASGLSLVRKLRERLATRGLPQLLVIADSELGALSRTEMAPDDVIVFPVLSAELLARMRLLDLRFANYNNEERIQIGELILDLGAREFTIGGRRVDLTYQEFELIACLAETPGRMFSRDALLERAWGADYEGGTRTVDVHVRRLRAKLGQHAERIETVRGGGYRIRAHTE